MPCAEPKASSCPWMTGLAASSENDHDPKLKFSGFMDALGDGAVAAGAAPAPPEGAQAARPATPTPTPSRASMLRRVRTWSASRSDTGGLSFEVTAGWGGSALDRA